MSSPYWEQKESQLSNITLPVMRTHGPSPTTPTRGPPSPTALGGPPLTISVSIPPPTAPTHGPPPTTPTGGPPVYLPVSKTGPEMATPIVSPQGLVAVTDVQDEIAKEPSQTRLAHSVSYVRPAFSYQLASTLCSNPSSSHYPVSDRSSPPVSHDSTENIPRASFQPIAIVMNASIGSFAPGSSVVLRPPKLPSTESTAFSFTGSVQLVHKDQLVKSNDSVRVTAMKGSTVSSSLTSSTVQNASTTAIASTSPPNSPASWPLPARTFEETVALQETLRPPGLRPPQLMPLLRTPSAPPEPPPSMFRPTFLPPNPLPYTPLSAMAPPHPGLWLRPPQPSGLTRPPFLPYPTIVPPSSFPLPNLRMPFPPVAGINLIHTGGVIPPRNATGSTQSVSDSVSHSPSYISSEVLPPGIDDRKQPNDGEGSKQPASVTVDVWTVHKAASGVDYYYNSKTGESTYIRPAGFSGVETNKGTTKPTAVSWEKVMGMDWVSVSTTDGREYYHNSKTKLSCWEMPPEVADMRKKQDTMPSKELNGDSVTHRPIVVADKGNHFNYTSAVYRHPGDATTVRPNGGVSISTALDLIKKKLQDPGAPAAVAISSGSGPVEINGSKVGEATFKALQGENGRDKQKGVSGDPKASDVSSDSEKEDGGRTKEEVIVQFKEMLKDRGVAPFSKWHKELPKIVFDPRFKMVVHYPV